MPWFTKVGIDLDRQVLVEQLQEFNHRHRLVVAVGDDCRDAA